MSHAAREGEKYEKVQSEARQSFLQALEILWKLDCQGQLLSRNKELISKIQSYFARKTRIRRKIVPNELTETLTGGFKPSELREELQKNKSKNLNCRRTIIGLSLLEMGAMTAVTLLQTGIIKHLPDLPINGFDSDKVKMTNIQREEVMNINRTITKKKRLYYRRFSRR